MAKTTVIKIVTYFVGLVMPILGMLNCGGHHEGTMQVSSCIIDCSITRSYANFYWGWVTMSSFMLGIPIIIYIVVVIQLAKNLPKRFV